MNSRMNRRRFLQTSAAAGYFYTATAVSAARAADGPNSKIRFAGIGVGGKGSSDISHARNLGEVVALCDVDENHLNAKANEKDKQTGEQRFLSAKKYFDFRKMFDEMGKEIDAVTVSTADHTHAPASAMAMKLKKHVYCQKPLTHTVYEARQMRDIAKQYGVATQMGNQGSASSGLRRAVELIQSGIIGNVTEAHVWTNRPIWPQGADGILQVPAAREAALAALHGRQVQPTSSPPPKHVHWDEFLGPAPERPYARIYHPFSWRGWLDYGTGALGDMACHTANMAFRALKLGYPTSVLAEEVQELNSETFPTQAKVTFQFPARDNMGPVKFVWYEGQYRGRKLVPPDALVQKVVAADGSGRRRGRLVDSGSILVGDKGILYSPDDYGADIVVTPAGLLEGVNRTTPEKLPILKSSGRNGDQAQKDEWVAAIKGGPPPYSNFDFAAMLTETILLGNIAIRLAGQKLDWDGPNLKFTNNSKANDYVHYEYRKGWTL